MFYCKSFEKQYYTVLYRTFPQDQDKEYVGFATLPNQVHRKTMKKGFSFTLMVAGKSKMYSFYFIKMKLMMRVFQHSEKEYQQCSKYIFKNGYFFHIQYIYVSLPRGIWPRQVYANQKFIPHRPLQREESPQSTRWEDQFQQWRRSIINKHGHLVGFF